MDILSNFSRTLKYLMSERDLTVLELETAIGISNPTIYDYLNKKYIPCVQNLVRIANYFNCTTDYLLGLDDENLSEVFYEYKPFSEQLPIIKNRFECSEYYITKGTKISESLFNSWKRGKHEPSVENSIKIAKLFGCSLDFILGRSKH